MLSGAAGVVKGVQDIHILLGKEKSEVVALEENEKLDFIPSTSSHEQINDQNQEEDLEKFDRIHELGNVVESNPISFEEEVNRISQLPEMAFKSYNSLEAAQKMLTVKISDLKEEVVQALRPNSLMNDQVLADKDLILALYHQIRKSRGYHRKLWQGSKYTSSAKAEETDFNRARIKALLISEMRRLDKHTSLSWFAKIKEIPKDFSQEEVMEWEKLISDAEKEYKTFYTGWKSRLPMFLKKLFMDTWRDDKISRDLIKLHLRLEHGQTTGDNERQALRLERKWLLGIPLTGKEMEILQIVARRPNRRESKYIKKISRKLGGLDVYSLMEKSLINIIRRLDTNMKQGNPEYKKLSLALSELKYQKVEQETPWTKRDVSLLRALNKGFKSISLGDSLGEADRNYVEDLYETFRRTRRKESDGISYEILRRKIKTNADETSLLEKLRLEVGPNLNFGKQEENSDDRHLTHGEDEVMRQLAQECAGTRVIFRKTACPNALLIEKRGPVQDLSGINRRAIEVLSSVKSWARTNADLLAKLRNNLKLAEIPEDIDPIVTRFMEERNRYSKSDKALWVLKAIQTDSKLLEEFLISPNKLLNLKLRIRGLQEENTLNNAQLEHLSKVHDLMVNSMGKLEKAYLQVHSDKENNVITGLNPSTEMKLLDPLSNILTPQEIFKVVSYAGLNSKPSHEKMAIERLEELEKKGNISTEQARLKTQLRRGIHVLWNEEDQLLVKKLATEGYLNKNTNLPDNIQKMTWKLMKGAKINELDEQEGKILQNMKTTELKELSKIVQMEENNSEFNHHSRFTHISQMLYAAFERSQLDLIPHDAALAYIIGTHQLKIEKREATELQELSQKIQSNSFLKKDKFLLKIEESRR